MRAPLKVLCVAFATATAFFPGSACPEPGEKAPEARLAPDGGALVPDAACLDKAFDAFAAEAERRAEAGPRFPMPAAREFLLRTYARTRAPRALALASRVLSEMAAGGIRDQLGGAFHRYSVDGGWRLPRFEKTLGDNAQLASVYLQAYQAGKDPEMARVARQILDDVLRDLSRKDGGFYSSEGGDSPAGGKPSEGAFYLWREPEIVQALGQAVAEVFCWRYGVRAEGNLPPESGGDRRGANVLYAAHTAAETARRFGRTEGELERMLGVARESLRAARERRARPAKDDEVVVAWNGLMISALAQGAQVLGDGAYLKSAERTARFLRRELYDAKSRRLSRYWRRGRSATPGMAADYALLAQGLLDLYEASFDPDWLDWALELGLGLEDRLSEGKGADRDDSEPGAVAALDLLRLAQYFGRPDLRAAAQRILARHGAALAAEPLAHAKMLTALGALLGRQREIVLSGEASDPGIREMLRAVHARYLPEKVLMVVPPGPVQKRLAARIPALKGMTPIGGKPTAYICIDFACELPTTDLRAVGDILDGKGAEEGAGPLKRILP